MFITAFRIEGKNKSIVDYSKISICQSLKMCIVCIYHLESPLSIHIAPALQVLSSGRCRTSWAAGQCHETTTTRQAASQTGAA